MRRISFLLPFLLCAWTGAAAQGPASPHLRSDIRPLHALTPLEQDEVLWLARCLLSETNFAHEQRLVAWVVRNRVETRYRGDRYREVVLEPMQFSAFNTPSARRDQILGLNQYSGDATWRQALDVALEVYQADASANPFAITTRHFYSPISMPGRREPPWSSSGNVVDVSRHGVDPLRFRFFDGIDAALDPALTNAARSASERIDEARERIQARRPASTASDGKVQRPERPTVKPPRRGW
jgi:hypothetical protein